MSAVINFALSCISPCKYQYIEIEIVTLITLAVYLLSYLFIYCPIPKAELSYTSHMNKYGPHRYLED